MTIVKGCSCRASASIGAVRMVRDHGRLAVTLVPGLSCDQCGTPWKLIQSADEREARDDDGRS